METRPFLEVPVWSLRWARGGGRGFRLPLPTLTTSPLALSRFLRRAAAGACKNRSAAPAAAPCFVHWTRSPPLPWTQKRKSQRSKAGKNNSSWPVETFRASNGERVFSDRPLPAAPIGNGRLMEEKCDFKIPSCILHGLWYTVARKFVSGRGAIPYRRYSPRPPPEVLIR